MIWLWVSLLTVLGGGLAMGLWHHGTPWSPVRHPAGHFVQEQHHKGRLVAVEAGVQTASWPDFECKAETGWDRFFKRLGWSVEYQVGRPLFDRRVYLYSDDPRIEVLFQSNADLCTAVQRLFEHRFVGGARPLRLTCRDGMLRLIFGIGRADAKAAPLVDQVVPMLQRLQAALPPAGAPGTSRRDRAFFNANVVRGLAWGLAANGALQIGRLQLFGGNLVADRAELLRVGLAAGGVVLVLLLATTAWLMLRSSRLHSVLLQVLLVGGFGSLASGWSTVHDLNVGLDSAPGKRQFAMVVGRAEGPFGLSHYFKVGSGGLPFGFRVRTSKSLALRTWPGQAALIEVRPGALGMAWVPGFVEPTQTERDELKQKLDEAGRERRPPG